MSFEGKVVLVTGAGSGVGAEIARHFLKLGASVVVSDYRSDVKSDEDSGDDFGSNYVRIPADLTKPEDVFNVVNQTISKYERLDVLVNCVGRLETNKNAKKRTTLERFDRSMNVNVRAIYQLTILATPHLVKSKGNVVNVCGLNGMSGLPYRVAKAGLYQLTRSLADLHVADGVRVNSVTPNVVDDVETTEDGASRYPSGLTQEPKRVADAVVLIVSDLASHIAGADLPVNVHKHHNRRRQTEFLENAIKDNMSKSNGISPSNTADTHKHIQEDPLDSHGTTRVEEI